ncbi:hypothetical protein ACNKHS_26005 [Shigella flexneri]
MSPFTPASEVLLRHSDELKKAVFCLAGDLQDDLPHVSTRLKAVPYPVLHHWQVLAARWPSARFSLTRGRRPVDCDSLIYYWPKNKPEPSSS